MLLLKRLARSLGMLTGLALIALAALGMFLLNAKLRGHAPFSFIGDYTTDSDPAIRYALGGHPFSMFSVEPTPLMLPVALLVRIPAVGLAQLLGYHPGMNARYELGALAVFMVIAAVILRASWGPSRRERLSAVGLLLFALIGPLSIQATNWGHVEETLGAFLLCAALIAAGRERWRFAALCAAAAGATKQPDLLAGVAILLLLQPRRRRQAEFIGGLLVLTVPFLIASIGALTATQNQQIAASGGGAPHVIDVFHAFGIASWGWLSRPSVVVFAIVLPLLAAWRGETRWRLSALQASAVLAIVLFLRAMLDPYNISYYALPAVAALAAWEWLAWRAETHPLRRLRALSGLPLLAFAANFAVNAASGGLISRFVTAYLNNNYGVIYVLVVLVISLALVPVAFRLSFEWDRSRQLLYGGMAAAVIAIVLGLFAFGKPPRREMADPIGGWTALSPGAIAKATTPTKVYWLGGQDLSSSVFLRTIAMRTSKRREGLDISAATVGTPLTLFDYGLNTEPDSVSVFTLRPGKVSRGLRRLVANCSAGSKRCAKGAKLVQTPIGPAIVFITSSSVWNARVAPRGERNAVYVDSALKITPEQVLRRLRVVRPADRYKLAEQQS